MQQTCVHLTARCLQWGMRGRPLVIWIFVNKLVLFLQIHFSLWTNAFSNLDKYILQFEQKPFTVRHAHRALDGPPLVIWIFANKLFHICRLIKSLIPHQIFCNIYFASNIPDQIFEYLWANWSPFVSTSNLCCFSRLLQKRICRRRSFYDLSVNSPDPFLTSPRAPTNSTRIWISTCPFPLLLNFCQKTLQFNAFHVPWVKLNILVGLKWQWEY